MLTAQCLQHVYVEIHPTDAANLGINPDERVQIKSQRGTIRARAMVAATVQPGQLFIPMHYEETNQLTFPDFDPYSKQPSYKHCAVSIRRIAHFESRNE